MNRRRHPLLVIAVAVALALAAAGCDGIGGPSPEEIAAERAAVEEVLQRWVDLYNAGEFEAMADLYADGAFLMYPEREAVRLADPAEIVGHLEPGLPEGMELRLGTPEIAILDDAAVFLSPWEVVDEEGPASEGYYLAVLSLEAGEWRIDREIYNYQWRREE